MISVLYRNRLIRLSAGRQRLVRSGPARKEQIKSFVEDDEMKEKKRRISVLALLLALALCLSACGGGGDSENGDGDSAYDDTIAIDMNSEITNFDPAYLSGMSTSRVACFMMDHLCYMDHDGNIIPRVAESWEPNEDATVWTFHLRKDVKWHDGTPLVAADVKYNFDRIIDPEVAALRASDMACIESVEAPDDYTVVFNLNTPVAAFITKCLLINPGLLAQPAALEEYGESYSDNVVGTGPYKLVEWVPGEKVVMEANPDFYLGEPATKYIEFRLIPDSMTALIELEQGNLDFLFNIPSSELGAFETNENISLERAKDFGVSWIFLNTAMEPCNDINVRKAIAHAIDYDTIYNTILTEYGVPADSYLPMHNWAYTPDTVKYNYDPDLARELLAEAGWTDTDGDGFVDKNGQTMKLEIGCTKRESDNMMLEAAQNYLKQVGIDVSMSLLESAAFDERLAAQDFQAYVLSISQDSPEPALLIDFAFTSYAGYNKFGYNNPEVDELVLQANSTGDQETRKELYIQIQKIIKEDYVSLPFYSRYAQVGVSSKVEGFTHSAAIFNLEDVKVKK